MKQAKKLFKVIRTETTTQTAYIFAESADEVNDIIANDLGDYVDFRENQYLDCQYGSPTEVKKKDYEEVKGLLIDYVDENGEIESKPLDELLNK